MWAKRTSARRVALAHSCGVVQGRDVRVLRCLGRLEGVREPGRGEHEREVSERAGCASGTARRSASTSCAGGGKVVDDRWGSAAGQIVGSAQEKRVERRSWAGAAREAIDMVDSGWHIVQVHKVVRGSGAKHDARERAITRQMPSVQAEDGR
jgi:hypothetical protein